MALNAMGVPMPSDRPFWPEQGNGPGWKEIVGLILFAAIFTALIVWLFWRTETGRNTPVVEEPAQAAEHRHIAKPRE
jgi:ABC-type uncharacterized transport system permease subunit